MSAPRLHPADLAVIADIVAKSENVPIERAASYLDVGRRSVERFMAAHPKCVVVDDQNRRRVRRNWLDAWSEGRHAVAALERARS